MNTKQNEFEKIQCTPTELHFKSLNRGGKQKSSLTLTNPTKNKYAFKVKTTCPKCYVVQPSVGFVEPESAFRITIIKQRNPKPNTLDKFLIEAMKTSCEQTIAAKTQMKAAKKEELQRIKLRVFVDGPSIDIDNSEDLHSKTTKATHTTEVWILRNRVTALEAEVQRLNDQLRGLKKHRDLSGGSQNAMEAERSSYVDRVLCGCLFANRRKKPKRFGRFH